MTEGVGLHSPDLAADGAVAAVGVGVVGVAGRGFGLVGGGFDEVEGRGFGRGRLPVEAGGGEIAVAADEAFVVEGEAVDGIFSFRFQSTVPCFVPSPRSPVASESGRGGLDSGLGRRAGRGRVTAVTWQA